MIVAFAFALALQSAPAPAAPPAKPAKGSPEEIVCKFDTDTGTIIAKRTCHTRRQWDEMSEAGKQALDNYHTQSLGGGPR